MKAKIIKLDPIKLKSFCTAKETTDKMKREPTGENIFSNDMTNNGLISNIQKQIIQLNIKKIKNLVKKLSRTEQSIWMASRHMGRCSTYLVIRECKTTMRYHLTPITMASFKKNIAHVGEDVEKRESSYTIDWNVNWCCHF